MRRERGEPVDSKIPYPDYQNKCVDWEDPDHEDEDRVCVIVKVVTGVEALEGSVSIRKFLENDLPYLSLPYSHVHMLQSELCRESCIQNGREQRSTLMLQESQ